jgi:hypothetical protein
VGRKKDVVGYYGMHGRIKAARGSATGYKCVLCGDRGEHWAYNHSDPSPLTETIKGTVRVYSLDMSCYQAMCFRCHKRFDTKK